MHPAARIGDPHECKPHGASPISAPGCPTVLIGGAPAARQGDAATCSAGPDAILDGSPTVRIGNQAAARQTERFAHGGTVVVGCPTVLIGNPAVGPDGRAIAVPPECKWLLDFGAKGTGKRLDRLRDAYDVKGYEVGEITPPKTPRQPYELSGETYPRAEHTKQVVVIRGHEVTIYEPTTGVTPPAWLPTSANIAKGLATLSDEQLAGLKEVYIVSDSSSDSAADHHKGVVRYFPRDKEHPQSDIDWALQHESAHALWDARMQEDAGFRSAWQRAADQDHRTVTDYGDKRLGEDFAEFMILYANVLGSPCEGSARALFKHRMQIMDGLFPNGLPVRNPSAASKPY
jgi:uncharacterized Zn-binding protein involved in type VI secretion